MIPEKEYSVWSAGAIGGSKDDTDETTICKQCGEHYTLRHECEPTDYCDLCAQTMLVELQHQMQSIKAHCFFSGATDKEIVDHIKRVADSWLARERMLEKQMKAYRYAVLAIKDILDSAKKEWLESLDIESPLRYCNEAIAEAESTKE